MKEVTVNITSRMNMCLRSNTIRTAKDQATCIFNVFSFRKPLQNLLIELVYASTFWLIFPHSKWLWGKNRPHQSLCDRKPGSYVQVQEQQDNSIGEQTTREIAILPTGDSQGGWLLTNSRDDNYLGIKRPILNIVCKLKLPSCIKRHS